MNQLTRRPDEDAAISPGPITVLRTQLEQRAAEFRMVLPAHITPEKFQRTVLTAVQSNPDLLKTDRRSFLTACMKAAHDGSLPDGREAAIVPFNTKMKVDGEWRWVKLAQYMPMVFGLRKKILQSEEVTDIFAAVVYRQEIEAGRFIYEEGTERQLRHKPILEPDFRPDDADIALAYSVATFANGFKSFEVMRRYEIDEVRESSQTGAEHDAKGEPRDPKGPWVDWFSEMAKKTVIRRHSKSLPQSSDIIADVEADDMAFASRSALALLEGTKAEPSRPMIADDEPLHADNNGEEPHDEETGEVKPRRGRPPKATQLPAEPKPEPHMLPPEESAPFEPEPEPEADIPPAAVEAEKDELGVTKTDDEIRAEGYIAAARACELLVDFRKLERDAEMDLADMPVHISAIVDTEFAKARTRLTPRREK